MTTDWVTRGSIPTKVTVFFKRSNHLYVPTSLLLGAYQGPLPCGESGWGLNLSHSPPYSAEAKKECSYASADVTTCAGTTLPFALLLYCTDGLCPPGNIPGGKGDRCVGLTTLPPSCDECHESWEAQPHGTLTVCLGIVYL